VSRKIIGKPLTNNIGSPILIPNATPKGMQMEAAVENGMVSGLRSAQQRQEDHERRAQHAHGYLADMLSGSVKAGADIVLPRPGCKVPCTVSEMLGEPSPQGRELLMKACREALHGRDSGQLLRDLVALAAREYADDFAADFAGEA
jgi:hypothetical protein